MVRFWVFGEKNSIYIKKTNHQRQQQKTISFMGIIMKLVRALKYFISNNSSQWGVKLVFSSSQFPLTVRMSKTLAVWTASVSLAAVNCCFKCEWKALCRCVSSASSGDCGFGTSDWRSVILWQCWWISIIHLINAERGMISCYNEVTEEEERNFNVHGIQVKHELNANVSMLTCSQWQRQHAGV